MVKYKLYYFPFRGSAEVIRLLLAYAEVEYEDIRIPMQEWPKHKPNMPMGVMPCLEVDGEKMGQSGAIARYLAREHGMSGNSSKEEYHIDMLVCCLDDVRKKFPRDKDEAKQADLMKEYIGVTVPDMLKNVEKIATSISGKDGFFVSKLSVADLSILSLGDLLLTFSANLFDATPRLKSLYENAKAVPKIAAWIEKRPKTDF